MSHLRRACEAADCWRVALQGGRWCARHRPHCTAGACRRLAREGRPYCRHHERMAAAGGRRADAPRPRPKARPAPTWEATDVPCKVPDCPGATIARGWCWRHYRRWLRSGSVELRERPKEACAICSAPAYRRIRAGSDLGSGSESGPGPIWAGRQLCRRHYQRAMTHGDPLHQRAYVNLGHHCSEAGCVKPARALGMCRNHYDAAWIAGRVGTKARHLTTDNG